MIKINVEDYLNLVYQKWYDTNHNQPTRVTKKNATAIDHIITNSFIENIFKTTIINSEIKPFQIIFLFVVLFLQQIYLQNVY